jgi:dTDP-4-amino-4,6-dideoxygalactose transaminase
MNFIPLMQPGINDSDIEAVANVLRSGMLVQGKSSLEFEKEIAAYLGCKHSILVSNGTASLHLALIALGIEKGDEVIVPAFSYVATANVVELVGATPVFVDVSIDDFNIDTSQIEKHITPRTKAIMPVHEFGIAANMDAITKLAKKHNLKIIEDAACALGAKYNGKFVGTLSDIGSFSLHPRKSITSGEGGIITTDDDAIADKIMLLRNHGQRTVDGEMIFEEAGFNYRLTDFQAALAQSQFSRMETIVAVKEKIAQQYFSGLQGNKKLKLPKTYSNKNHTWQTFHVVVDDAVKRNTLIKQLREKNIGTNYGAQCIPYQKYYLNKYNLDCKNLFPNAMRSYENGIALPMFEKLTDEQVNYVVQNINTLTA